MDEHTMRIASKGLHYMKEMSDSLTRLESTLARGSKSTNTTRIGALRRISAAVEFMKRITTDEKETQQDIDTAINILLGTE